MRLKFKVHLVDSFICKFLNYLTTLNFLVTSPR